MASSAPNAGAAIAGVGAIANTLSQVTQAVQASLRSGIDLKNGEHELFCKWPSIPHPDILVDSLRENLADIIPAYSPELREEGLSAMTAKQSERFRLFAEKDDIAIALQKLFRFVRPLLGIINEEV